jgi:hypothetical protein
MWCRVPLVTTGVSEARIPSIIRMKRITVLGTTLALTCNWSTRRGNLTWLGIWSGGDYQRLREDAPWPLVRERTIPTERPPLDEILVLTFVDRGVLRGQRGGSPRPLISVFYTGVATFLPSSSSFILTRAWVDPIPDPLLLRKFGSAGYRTRDLWVSSQELWPLDHRGGLTEDAT